MKFTRFIFLLLSAELLHAQPADFIPIPIGKGERGVSLTATGIAESDGGDILLETVNPQGEIRHRLIFSGNRITELPSGWRVLPGEGPTSILMQKEDRLVCYYWNYSDYTKRGISFSMSPGEQSAWRNLRREALARQGKEIQKGCGFGFDDDAGMHHDWSITPAGVRELAHHAMISGVNSGTPSITGGGCLEGCYIIGGVNVTNTGYGNIDAEQAAEVYEPQFFCDPNAGLQVRYSKLKSQLVNPAMACDEATLYHAGCAVRVLVSRHGAGKSVSIADIEQAKLFRSLPIDDGDHSFISAFWCAPKFYFLSNGIVYWVSDLGEPSWRRDMAITMLHPESLSPISRQETDLK